MFAGGATFEAIEAVCGDGGEVDVLDSIDALVDSSLLMCGPDRTGEGRFTMLETIREYALERLDGAGETERVRRAHATYFVELAESLGADLWGGPRQIASSYRLELEQDNIRAALQWTFDAGEGALALRLAAAMRRFWIMRAYMTEGRRWLQSVLDLHVPDHLVLRCQAIHAAGWLAANQHDFEVAVALFEQGLEIARTIDNRHTVAEMVVGIGHTARMQGDFTRAVAMFQQGADLGREVGDKRTVALSVGNHGMIAHALGEIDQAAALLEEARDLHQQLGDQEDVAWSLAFLGRVARTRGDTSRAHDHLVESLLLFMELADRNGAVFVVEGLAGLATSQPDGGRAAQLFGAAEALREAINLPMVPFDRPEYERDVEAGRSTVEPDTWREAWQVGRAMGWDEAVQIALNHNP